MMLFFLYKTLILKTILVLLGLGGFLLARKIHLHKKKAKPLVCPMRSNCETVVHSDYSKIAGIPLEVLGMAYYGFIFFFYFASFFVSVFSLADISFYIVLISIFAFCFSVYLVCLQAFVIKEWCAWCLGSAVISLFIAIVAYFHADLSLLLMGFKHKIVFVILHGIAAAVGVGATTVTDTLFFKFLKDYQISESEKAITKTLSGIIWFAIVVLLVTGVFLTMFSWPDILQNTKFVAKMILVLVVVLNGSLLNFYISKKLTSIPFGEKSENLDPKTRRDRKLAFFSGGLSLVTWYSIFILGSVRSLPLSVWAILIIYIVLVLGSFSGAMFFEKKLERREI